MVLFLMWATEAERRWEAAKQDALDASPLVFVAEAPSELERKALFCAWARDYRIVPEVLDAVLEWIGQETTPTVNAAITNEETGAVYIVAGLKQGGAVVCQVKFVGNIHWE